MSGWGSIDFMRKSYENNRNLLGRHKSLKELYAENHLFENHSPKFKVKPAKPGVIHQIHTKMDRQHRLNRLKSMIALIISIALVSFAFTVLPII
jgi:hypothetical protein